jgi:cytochrome c biogenesis protein CcmG, thiol:disulfide interchange protein DsbE
MSKQPTTRSQPTRRGPASNRTPAGKGRVPIVAIALGLILLLGLVAVVLTRGDGPAGGSSAGTAAPGVEQTRPVQVTGQPLPPFDDGAASDPALGATAPEVRGASFDGRPVAITHDGTPRVILFVAHWCPHCRREVPVVKQWLAGGGLPAGVELVTVSTSVSPDRPNYPPSTWLAKAGWTAPVLADDDRSTTADAFGLTAFPYFVLVDGHGKVVARSSGELRPAGLTELVSKLKPA